MKKKNICLAGFCAALFLFGAAGSLAVWFRPHGSWVNVMQDGMVLYSFDLSSTPDQTIDIEYNGSINTIQIKDGRIRVLSAECPDKTCVHMGWLESGALPVVCLPNRLVIGFAERESVDAVVK
ncbi:MAG: NusG domain II-containing protein [Lachnospiraceae bacterium]|nr:NusG domain II-containing protein [Lachnospiraceae bacterium]